MKCTDTELHYAGHVLVFDRWANCLRCVDGMHAEILDDTGTSREFTKVDTEAGYLWYVGPGCRIIRERGEFRVVLSDKFKHLYGHQ